jgi:Rod binding domain-containing protein
MKIAPIDALTNGRQTADARALSSGQAAPTDAASDSTGVTSAASTAAARKVAEQFEAIFLRKLMSGLEKSGSLSGTPSTGSQIYGSMMVGAFADKASEGGGLGLASLVLKSLLPQAPSASASGGIGKVGATSSLLPVSHAGTAKAVAGLPLTPALDIGTGFGGGKP